MESWGYNHFSAQAIDVTFLWSSVRTSCRPLRAKTKTEPVLSAHSGDGFKIQQTERSRESGPREETTTVRQQIRRGVVVSGSLPSKD